jgi:hypothetical protein
VLGSFCFRVLLLTTRTDTDCDTCVSIYRYKSDGWIECRKVHARLAQEPRPSHALLLEKLQEPRPSHALVQLMHHWRICRSRGRRARWSNSCTTGEVAGAAAVSRAGPTLCTTGEVAGAHATLEKLQEPRVFATQHSG